MKTIHALFLTLLLTACVSTGSHGSNPDATKQFEKLKMLEGRWSISGADEPGANTVSYHITSGGSVVMEDLFNGTPREMVTMYHLDKGALVMTHYCALGNQPTMEAAPLAADGSMTFTCHGGGNLDCEKDMHMHQAVITIVDKNHVKTDWTLRDKGKLIDVKHFELVRS